MQDLEQQFYEDMQQSILEEKSANCDFDSQKKYEERLSVLNSHTREIKKQLTEVEYYMTVPDEISAKIKCEYLLKAVNELCDSLNYR